MPAAPIALFVLLLAATPAKAASPSGQAPVAEAVKQRAGKALDEADVRLLLRDWAVFERAMASIPDSVPEIPAQSGSSTDLAAAEAAWAADARVRRILEEGGTSPETFLAVYRKVAQAWWELLEREASENAAAALRREIAALRETGDEDAKDVVAELERGLEALHRGGRPSPEVTLVRRYRTELGRVFSPAGSTRAP
jgi:hypothetical protein